MKKSVSAGDDKDKYDALNAKALLLQRKQRLAALTDKRRMNFNYFKRFYDGDHHWMNCVLVSKSDLHCHVQPQLKCISFFYLGLSVSQLLDTTADVKPLPIVRIIRSLTQLMEEYDYHFSSTAMQSVKYVLAKHSTCMYPQLQPNSTVNAPGAMSDPSENSANEPTPIQLPRPVIHKFQSDVVYEHLLTPHIGFSLDFGEVLQALSDSLCRLYDLVFRDSVCYRFVSCVERCVWSSV